MATRPKPATYTEEETAVRYVEQYGNDFDIHEILRIRKMWTFRNKVKNEKVYAGERGPVVAKHYITGYRTGTERMFDYALELLAQDRLPGLCRRYTMEGVRNQMYHIVEGLATAAELHLWEEDLVGPINYANSDLRD